MTSMCAAQVVLEMEDVDAGLVIVQAPPNAFVGPPGLYMLFLLSEGVPSVAAWVSPPIAGPASCQRT